MEERIERIENLVRTALEEDAAGRDITTGLLIDGDVSCSGSIEARMSGVVSGHEPAETVFRIMDDDTVYEPVALDGQRVSAGDTVARIVGRTAPILSGERTALNFLQHLSGIATLTARFVELAEGSGIKILDTRKTTPGLRILEKAAVVHGGGKNHRRDLAERVLVKENHIAAAGGIGSVVEKLSSGRSGEAEIEVSSLEELSRLLVSPPGRVMLDNFTPEMVRLAVDELRMVKRGTVEVEVSGGITLDTIGEYLIPGVNFISIGSLTLSAPALDMSLIVEAD